MRTVKISKFVQDEEKVEWMVENLLPNVGWTLFYGEQAVGKTTFTVQLCAALQEGTAFMGRKTRQTRILYIQADSPTPEWREMLRRIAPDSEGYTCIDVPEGCLGNPSYVSTLANYVSVFKPGFLVFDSLYNLTAWSINTDLGVKMVTTVLKDIAKATKSPIPIPFLVIHHPPQMENRAAGNRSLSANASNVWGLLRTKLKIEKGRLIKDKEILLSRDEEGLWILHKRGTLNDTSGIYDRHI
jgi:hypothetical protein